MDISHLINIIASFSGRRIAVIGDLMLDAYIWGKANRISPEAPVPVVEVERESCCLGGAANVMRNIVTLGGSACAYGVLGNDKDGVLVREMMSNYRIDASNVLIDNSRITTRKQRVLGDNQQLLRIDYEDTSPLCEKIRAELFERLSNDIANNLVDAVIFEDYGKGVLSTDLVSRLTQVAKENNVITALDPKPGNLEPIRGLTVMKPNRNEAFAMCKKPYEPPAVAVKEDKALLEVANEIAQNWDIEQLIISLAAQGMALFRKDLDSVVIPTRAIEVYDVSGAGDTVISAYTLALASGATPVEAAIIANYAAGVVVGKVGTVPVEKDELLEALNEGSR